MTDSRLAVALALIGVILAGFLITSLTLRLRAREQRHFRRGRRLPRPGAWPWRR